jgi:hypothetical protein
MGSVSFQSHFGFGNNIHSNQAGYAVYLKGFAHETIAGTEIQHSKFGKMFVGLINGRFEDRSDFCGRGAFESIIEYLLIESGNFIDFIIVVKSYFMFLALRIENIKINLVLF